MTSRGFEGQCFICNAKNFGLPWSKRTADALMADDRLQVLDVVQNANGGSWSVVDTDTQTVIATFDSRLDAIRYADEFSTVQREGFEAGDPGFRPSTFGSWPYTQTCTRLKEQRCYPAPGSAIAGP